MNQLVRSVRHIIKQLSKVRLRGWNLNLNLPDRLILEDVILPHLVSKGDMRKILFVGCDWYTKSYEKSFKNRDYWTIDIDEKKKKYGSKKHIVGRLQDLSAHIESNYFDLIICNGVFGRGMNTREDAEDSFNQCFRALRDGGLLVFGWSDVDRSRPFPVVDECQSLRKFEPYYFAPLSTSQYLTPHCERRHIYNFYFKPPKKEKVV